MPEGRKSSAPVILLALSGVGVLLSIGLCGLGGSNGSATAGIAVLVVSVLLFLVGIIWFIAAR